MTDLADVDALGPIPPDALTGEVVMDMGSSSGQVLSSANFTTITGALVPLTEGGDYQVFAQFDFDYDDSTIPSKRNCRFEGRIIYGFFPAGKVAHLYCPVAQSTRETVTVAALLEDVPPATYDLQIQARAFDDTGVAIAGGNAKCIGTNSGLLVIRNG